MTMSRWLLIVGCLAWSTGCGDKVAAGSSEPDDRDATSASLGAPLVYFGYSEVKAGALKSSDGQLPTAGGSATLRLFLPELAMFTCGDYCVALEPTLYVRYRSSDLFTEI